MLQRIGNLSQDQMIAGAAGFVCSLFIIVLIALFYLFPELSTANRALVLASSMGAIGTLALAIATFFNVLQTSRSLEYREKERTKPLVVDELTNIIQPAIDTLEANLEGLSEPKQSGCTFEWVYLNEAAIYKGGRKPNPINPTDAFALGRLWNENRELFGELRAHDDYIEDVAESAQKFHRGIEPTVMRLLKEEEIDIDEGPNLKAISNAILMKLDYFPENHTLHEFWEEHHDDLLSEAGEIPGENIDSIQAGERVYGEMAKRTLQKLRERKGRLKFEYGISNEEIIVNKSPDRTSI